MLGFMLVGNIGSAGQKFFLSLEHIYSMRPSVTTRTVTVAVAVAELYYKRTDTEGLWTNSVPYIYPMRASLCTAPRIT